MRYLSGRLLLAALLSFLATGPVSGAAKPTRPNRPPPGPEIEAAFNQPPPSDWVRTAFDLETINVKRSLSAFLDANSALLGGIEPQKMTVAAALDSARAMAAQGPNAAALATVRNGPQFQTPEALRNVAVVAVANHCPLFAVGVLLVAEGKAPADPRTRFNLASLLAQLGKVNEAEALLDDLYARQALPEHFFGITAQQGGDYLRGYLWMRQGKFKEAAALLKPIVAANPAFGEADLTLALLDSQLGEDPRPPYIAGVWRRAPRALPPDDDQGSGGKRSGDQAGDDAGDDSEKPNLKHYGLNAGLFVDLSKGKPGELPAVEQPVEILDRIQYREWAKKTVQEMGEEVAGLGRQRQEAYERCSKKELPEAVRKRVHELDRIIDVENARMPELHALKKALDRAKTDEVETLGRLTVEFGTARLAIISSGKSEDQQCQELLALVDRCDGTLRASVQLTDTAIRRLHRYWHQYATALGALTSDPDFREYLALYVKMEDRVATLDVITTKLVSCNFAPIGEYCAKRKPTAANGLGKFGDPELGTCTEEDKKHSVGAEVSTEVGNAAHVEPVDLSVGIEANCNGVSLEVSAEVVKMLGLSAEVEVDREGTCTVFVGLKGELGPESVKAGGYLTMDKDSFQDAGVRMVQKDTVKAGIAGVSATYSHVRGETSASIFPGPDCPAHNESGLKNFVAPRGR